MIGLDAPARRAQHAAGGELVAGAVRAVQPLALHVLDLVVTDLLGERERQERGVTEFFLGMYQLNTAIKNERWKGSDGAHHAVECE